MWLVPAATLPWTLCGGDVFSVYVCRIAFFFSKMAQVTFDGAYAVRANVAQYAVEQYGWLRPGEMRDGLGKAETTPDSLIMALQFVGFMAAFATQAAIPLRHETTLDRKDSRSLCR